VVPQQALALSNSALTITESRKLAPEIWRTAANDAAFITESFLRILSRKPTADEVRLCKEFLEQQTRRMQGGKSAVDPPRERARANLVLVLFNHTDFVTIR
jgi:hypothetical protein